MLTGTGRVAGFRNEHQEDGCISLTHAALLGGCAVLSRAAAGSVLGLPQVVPGATGAAEGLESGEELDIPQRTERAQQSEVQARSYRRHVLREEPG